MEKERLSGYVMAVVGFIMLLVNASGYIFGWDSKTPAFTILGLVFVVIGMRLAKKTK